MGDEVARVPSPDGRLDAVLIETNGGATTSFGYEVYVVDASAKAGREPDAKLYGAVRSSQAYGVNLKWLSSARLSVEYLEARSATVSKPQNIVADRGILIQLRSGVNDPKAPPGGMLYNLQGRL